MKIKKLKKYLFLIPIIICIVVIGFIDPETFMQKIGVENTYLVMFILALIGGLSIFSSIPYPLFLITFALGGSNPYILALCTTVGVMMGDSVSYIIGKKGEKLLSGKQKEIFDMLLKFYDNKSRYLPGVFFLYGIMSPFPNDIITLSAGFKRYNYYKMIIPLSFGNLIFSIVLAKFADIFAPYF